MAMAIGKDVYLLAIGKTGNGKSATGNSILLRKAFKKSSSSNSVTSEIQQEFSEYKGRTIKVVDSPGICETRLEKVAAVKMVSEALKKAMLMNPKGYNAFLIVIKCGSRFTGEESDTIKFLKGFFGENFVRNYCILVMTCGDNFVKEFEDDEKTFESWCNEQGGVMKELLQECGNRIVLFDNFAKDPSFKEAQLDKLLDLVDNNIGGKCYSDTNFKEAKRTRKRLMVEAKKSIISENIIKETSIIIQKLEKIQSSYDEASNKVELHKLKERCAELLKETELKDKGTYVLIVILDSIKSLHTTIEAEIKFYERTNKEREEARRREEEITKRYEDEKENLSNQFKIFALKNKLEEKEELYRQMQEIQRQRDKDLEEIKALEKILRREREEECLRLKREKEEAERKFREATDKSKESLLSRGVEWLVTPLKTVGNLISDGIDCIKDKLS